MSMPDDRTENILRSLEERAKELKCLYAVDEILRADEDPPAERFRQIVEAVPLGWQYPEVCSARLTVFNVDYALSSVPDTPWVMRAPITVRGHDVGELAVYYSESRPRADEGPFLGDERRLLDALAEQIGLWIAHHEDPGDPWTGRETEARPEQGRKWRILAAFLERMDPQLRERIARKMGQRLRLMGIGTADSILVTRTSVVGLGDADGGPASDGNDLQEAPLPTDRILGTAASHVGEEKVLRWIEMWVNEDKLSSLADTLEGRQSTLPDVIDALERFSALGLREDALPSSVQVMLRTALCRHLLTDHVPLVNIAKEHVTMADYQCLTRSIIHPPSSGGKLGGKSASLFLAQRIVQQACEEHAVLREVRVPRTWYVTSDGILSFIRHNNLEDLYDCKYLDIEEVREQYPDVLRRFRTSPVPRTLLKGLAMALDDLGEGPLIVRSSSLLEDRNGATFHGKYKSVFLANQGSREERLDALGRAVAEVYASAFSPDPIEYRAERNLLDAYEELGVMIQEVVGTRVGRYFLPTFSGVAFSHNELRWSPRIRSEDGLVRLVPGLGTRAVNRLGDEYPVLLSPGQPGLRVNTTPDEVVRYSPRMVDLINLETGTLETVPLTRLLRECGNEIPLIQKVVSVVEDDRIRRPGPLPVDYTKSAAVAAFYGLAETSFLPQIGTLLQVLQERLRTPVEVEFASDGSHLFLLQCRSQSRLPESTPTPIPRGIPQNRVLFSAHRHISNRRVLDLTHIVYVDPKAYADLPELSQLRDVGRAVGRLNKLLPKRQFVLMGPGRWGSREDIRLGVGVTYSDLSNTAALAEIARRGGRYRPDLSFGTHFFQDMIEAGIAYLPLYPDGGKDVFNETFFRTGPNLLGSLLPEFAHLEETVQVVDVPRVSHGLVLRIVLDADSDEAVGYLAEPNLTLTEGEGVRSSTNGFLPRPRSEEHWRWRLRMAEEIASRLDPDRFGVVEMWVFGSTKNATAGPASDIDLLIHHRGTARQRQDLLLWLEGWSLSLAEMNYLRTGYRSDGLLDIHLVTDDDVKRKSSYAVKIHAVTDPARPLTLGGGRRERD